MKSYFLIVGDSFLVEEKCADIAALAVKEAGGEVTKQSFYLSDTPLATILTEARTLPFLVERQIFIIHQTDRLKKADQEILEPYFQNPNPQTILIFTAPSIDKRSGLDKFFIKYQGEAVFFDDSGKQGIAARFIRDKLKQFKKRMEPRLTKRLEELTGDAPAFLDSILNQLILYTGDREEITAEDLSHFEEKLAGIDVFNLIEAIGSRNTAEALRLYNNYMNEAGTDFFSLLGLLHWQMRRLWKGRIMLDEGAPAASITKQCKVFPSSKAGQFMGQLKTFPREKIERAIDRLAELDLGIKTGNMLDRMGMERWIIEASA